MDKIEKILYYLRMFFFVISLVLTFMLIQNITQVGISGYFYLFISIVFALFTIYQVITNDIKYKKDVIYNMMQMGFTIYLGVIVFKTYYDKIVVMDNTIKYFIVNYIILSVLLMIMMIYKIWDVKSN